MACRFCLSACFCMYLQELWDGWVDQHLWCSLLQYLKTKDKCRWLFLICLFIWPLFILAEHHGCFYWTKCLPDIGLMWKDWEPLLLCIYGHNKSKYLHAGMYFYRRHYSGGTFTHSTVKHLHFMCSVFHKHICLIADFIHVTNNHVHCSCTVVLLTVVNFGYSHLNVFFLLLELYKGSWIMK